ncbi:MAG: VTT domain-containing protein [Chthoniobacterales bacterium]|nr:VTT domain-containing protein [Chthoniobacterales bacterium]
MTFLHWFQENFIHLDKSLANIVSLYGIWVYAILFAIVFCETGLVVAPFLPGDALLFAIGAFAAAHPGGGLSYSTSLLLLCVAAIVGNIVNFALGSSIGGHIFKENAIILKKSYLNRAHSFFDKHGAKAVILARFLPIFRTMVPFVAGMAQMNRRAYVIYTVLGSFCWVFLMMTAGLLFGQIAWVQQHFEAVVIAIILVSMLPVAYEAVMHCRKK